MITDKLNGIVYGGDYNPEQWSREIWLEDMRLMKKAGVNLVSVGIFSWALLQSGENEFNFSFLDEIMDLLTENGIAADLATATAAQPAWLSRKHPDILPVNEEGQRLYYGSRQSYCPNSPGWRTAAARLVEKMAERYKDHPALVMWHANNEYSCHVQACYCETCEAAFRDWLKKKYENDITLVNESWGTRFWSQWYYSWDEIRSPRISTTMRNSAQILDYQRFMSDSLLDCYLMEKEILNRITPEIPITTNFIMAWKSLDYFKWAKEVDIVSWDAYPDPVDKEWAPVSNAFDHDLMRSLKNGAPFILMEQAPSQVNWRNINAMKPPRMLALYSYQAIARGADGIMYFQWRQSLSGSEKYHSACITHTGDETSRVFREVSRLGEELKILKEVAGSQSRSEVAIYLDYPTWWASEYQPGVSTAFSYRDTLLHFYRYFYKRGIGMDIVGRKGDFSRYKLICAPVLHMVPQGLTEKLESYTANGGIFLTGIFSGVVDEQDRVFPGGYPGPLKNLLGIQVEEISPLQEGEKIGYRTAASASADEEREEFLGSLWSEMIHLKGAEAVARYSEGYLAGHPAATKNLWGKGQAWYVSTLPEGQAMDRLLEPLCRNAGLLIPAELPQGMEVARRFGDGVEYIFLLNFNREENTVVLNQDGDYKDLLKNHSVSATMVLEPYESVILKKTKS